MRIWASNFTFDDIKGGTEKLGEQFCEAMNLQYMSAIKMGVPIQNYQIHEISGLFDRILDKMPIELIVHDSKNCWNRRVKGTGEKRIAVACENFYEEGKAISHVFPTESIHKILTSWEYQKKSLTKADKIVCISNGEGRDLLSYGYSPIVIEPYIDLKMFYPKDKIKCREEFPLIFNFNKDINKKMALYIGRRHQRKGWDIVTKLAEKFPDIKFVCMVGDDLLKWSNNIYFGHHVEYSMLNNLYNAADFLIMPTRYESFCYVYAEALACDLPIIASRTGLFKDWQPWDFGLFPKEITVNAFTDSINQYMTGMKFATSREMAEKRFNYERFKGDCDELLGDGT